MAYESTNVSVGKSQEQIRVLIYAHDGSGISFVSQRPREGFEALVTIKDQPYHIRVMAKCNEVNTHKGPGYRRRATVAIEKARQQEERRVWRVLYWHLKAMFEAADSGVIDLRDVIMPYVVTRDGRTLSEHIVPRMAEVMDMATDRLLPAAGGE